MATLRPRIVPLLLVLMCVCDQIPDSMPSNLSRGDYETPAALWVSTSAMTAACIAGGNAAIDSFQVRNEGGVGTTCEVSSNVNWVALSPSSGIVLSPGSSAWIHVSYVTAPMSEAYSPYGASVVVRGEGVETQTVALTLTVNPNVQPHLRLSRTALNRTCLSGSTIVAPDTLILDNEGNGTTRYTVRSSAAWISVKPDTGSVGTERDTLFVRYDTDSLGVADHPGTITVSSDLDTDLVVGVQMSVTSVAQPALAVSVSSMGAQCVVGMDAPVDSFKVWNAGQATLSYSAAVIGGGWLTIDRQSGNLTTGQDWIHVRYPGTDTLAGGTYSATIRLSGAGSSVDVAVNLTVTAPVVPRIAVDADTIDVSCVQGGTVPSQSFNVWNSGTTGSTLSYAVTADVTWIECSPSSGNSTGESDRLTVDVSASSLNAGTFLGKVTVQDTQSGARDTVVIRLRVTDAPQAVLAISRQTQALLCLQNSNPVSDTFTVWNSGASSTTLTYQVTSNVAWITPSLTSGSSTGERDPVTLTYSTAGLPAAQHIGVVTVDGGAAGTKQLTVTLTINLPKILSVSVSSLAATCTLGTTVTSPGFDVRNGGGGTMNFSLAETCGWLDVTPDGGSSTGQSDAKHIAVTLSTSKLSAGTHRCTVTVSSPGLADKKLPVSVTVLPKVCVRDDFSAGTIGAAWRQIVGDTLTSIDVDPTTYVSAPASLRLSDEGGTSTAAVSTRILECMIDSGTVDSVRIEISFQKKTSGSGGYATLNFALEYPPYAGNTSHVGENNIGGFSSPSWDLFSFNRGLLALPTSGTNNTPLGTTIKQMMRAGGRATAKLCVDFKVETQPSGAGTCWVDDVLITRTD